MTPRGSSTARSTSDPSLARSTSAATRRPLPFELEISANITGTAGFFLTNSAARCSSPATTAVSPATSSAPTATSPSAATRPSAPAACYVTAAIWPPTAASERWPTSSFSPAQRSPSSAATTPPASGAARRRRQQPDLHRARQPHRRHVHSRPSPIAGQVEFAGGLGESFGGVHPPQAGLRHADHFQPPPRSAALSKSARTRAALPARASTAARSSSAIRARFSTPRHS